MHIYTIDSADISLVAATAKTALQLVAGATRRSKIKEIGVSFASVTSTDAPVLAELRTQSTAGTSSAFTPFPLVPDDPAAIQTARNLFTVEPTDVALVYPGPWRVTPVGGLFIYQWPEGEELRVAISTRVGLRLTSPAALSNVRAYMIYQE